MSEETGVTSHDVIDRMVDFGVQHCMPSHMPMLVPEPFTMEPGESLTIEEMDHMLDAINSIAEEAYDNTEKAQGGPYNAATTKIAHDVPEDPDCWAFSYRGYRRKKAMWTSDQRRKIERHQGGY